MKNLISLMLLLWNIPCIGLSATYFYELYLHNEYYAEPPGFPSKVEATPIIALFSGAGDQWKEKRRAAGLVESIRLAYDHTWIELIAGLGKERVRFNHQGQIGEQSRFGWDDFLIDFGHNFLDEKAKKQLLLHWLIGIPGTKKVTVAEVEDPLWGTRTFATGPVIELAYDFVRNKAEDLFIGFIGRFLHRFSRSYEPILPPDAYLHPGRQINLLGLIHYRYYGHNFEFGYVYSLFNNISYEFPNHIEKLPSSHFNTFYADYFYFYEKLSLGLEFGLAKTFGKPFDGTTIFGLVAWYF